MIKIKFKKNDAIKIDFNNPLQLQIVVLQNHLKNEHL